MTIKMNSCPCGERSFSVDHTDLVDASGFIECEICGAPVLPVDINTAAVEAAMDSLKGERLAWKPSDFLGELSSRRDRILKSWADVLGDVRSGK